MTDDKDKIIAEALGICWHVFTDRNQSAYPKETHAYCVKCKHLMPFYHINKFDSVEGFFAIMAEAQKRDWWKSFCRSIGFKYYYDFLAPDKYRYFIEFKYIDPPLFRDVVGSWLLENQKEWRGK